MMEECKIWQKRTQNRKEWFEFFFYPEVKVFQGTKSFNPLDAIKGESVGLLQIHSSIIHLARTDFKLVGDGLFTDRKGLVLYIQTADCLPMIFYHPSKKILAILHAGWKGTG